MLVKNHIYIIYKNKFEFFKVCTILYMRFVLKQYVKTTMDKKYKLSDSALKTSVNKNLYVIIALKDFSDVKAGDVGGFV